MPTKKELSAALLSSKSLDEGPIAGATLTMRKHIELTSLIRSSPLRKRFSPSEYMSEMSSSTEDRLGQRSKDQIPPQIIEFLDMSATSHAKESSVEIDRPLFHAMPTEIVFQKYQPQKDYKFPLILRNSDKFARHVKVIQEDSPYFSLLAPSHPGGKVAPGMEVTYTVVFTPDSTVDYNHELVCITEREKFVIPIRAIGARGVVDFPDKVHFPTAPVKHTSTRTVLIRNVGTSSAQISLEASEPFSVTPSYISLEVGVCMQVDINFTPRKIGDHSGELVIHYETGEEVFVMLYGGAVDANVRLDRSTVKMENTYITMSSQRSITILNRSDVVVHYQWKAFSSELEEQSEKDLRAAQLTAEESIAKEALLEECIKDPGFRDRLSILGRTFDSRKQYVDEDKFLYSDDVVLIEPLEGDIWPNSQAEISIIFRPEEVASYSKLAFCDLTGRETRLPLKIKGDALGPKLQFSFDTLDIQNVFVDSSHSYEVILENKGEVEAAYSLSLPDSLFGPKFQFTPDEGLLQPGELQAIEISFQSSVLGDFCEEFIWNVNKATEPLRLTIQGRVIGPTFRFNVPLIDFKVISYGFVCSKEIVIHNTSEIPLKYSLRVPSDRPHRGAVSSQTEMAEHHPEGHDPTSGPEFVIRPRKGTLPPNCSKVIQIDFTPYQVRVYDEVMVVDVKGVGSNVFSLPVHADVRVPSITVSPSAVDLGDCYLYFPHMACVELVNESNLSARYCLQSQGSEDHPVRYSSIANKGVIPGNDRVKIPLKFEFTQSGVVDVKLPFVISGSSDPPVDLSVHCNAHGPLVNVSTSKVNWGTCPVLTALEKELTISNESLIPAVFSCTLQSERPVFSVFPSSGSVPPQCNQKLIVTAFVDDCLKFNDKLVIGVTDGTALSVALSVEGKGTTIVSEPPILGGVNLGPHFSNGPCRHSFTLTNKGRRMQALSWTTEGFSAIKKKKAEIARAAKDKHDVVKKASHSGHETEVPVFQVIPDKFVLCPNQTQVITIVGKCKKEQIVCETLLCHSIIGRNPLKEKIMSINTQAEFISPVVEIVPRSLNFDLVKEHGVDILQPRTKPVSLKNISPLHLSTILEATAPFFLSWEGNLSHCQEVSIEAGEEVDVNVHFDPSYCSDCQSRCEKQSVTVRFREHKHKDSIQVSSSVHFPNLDFDSREVDFGCILNDTEMTSFLTMINTSPVDVHYSWGFLQQPPVQRWVEIENVDEGVGLESDQEDREPVIGDGNLLDGEGPPGAEFSSDKTSSKSVSEVDVGDSSQLEMIQNDVETESVKRVETVADETGTVEELEQVRQTSEVEVDSGELDHDREAEERSECTSSVVPSSRRSGSGRGSPVNQPVPELQPETTDAQRWTPTSNSSQCEAQTNGTSLYQKSKGAFIDEDVLSPVSIQQIFDVLPLSGVLRPSETQQIQFTFYGHWGVAASAVAVCSVEGGPNYNITLSGEASSVSYSFDRTTIDCGKQLYDKVVEETLTLKNPGKVEFTYSVFDVDGSGELVPGTLAVSPSTGKVTPLSEQVLVVKYLPGLPEHFNVSFEIQVSHLEPQTISLKGEGVFPTLLLSCPRYWDPEGVYDSLKEKAMVVLQERGPTSQAFDEKHTRPEHIVCDSPVGILESGIPQVESFLDLHANRPLLEVEREMEHIAVKEFAIQTLNSTVTQQKPAIPDYFLDFGFVVYGNVLRRTMFLVNTGHFPINISVNKKALVGSGFSVDATDKIKALPEGERVNFTVTFDPASINCPTQEIMANLPFKIANGPCYTLRLRGVVTLPDIEVSSSAVDFGAVLCGQCKIVTIRLRNTSPVECSWSSVTEKPPKKPPKHMPLHLKKKFKEKPPPKFFEVNPPSGLLSPGQFMDVQIKFTPKEEVAYSQVIPLPISQNPRVNHCLEVKGQGCEPHIVFSKTMLEFGPILPYSKGDEQEVVVHNPTPHPVEIYSLEYDKQYLEEEKILCWIKGYDKKKSLFLPPLEPGNKLPFEILDAYKNEFGSLPGGSGSGEGGPSSRSPLEEESSQTPDATKQADSTVESNVEVLEHPPSQQDENLELDTKPAGKKVGELEITPVAAAIARYMGVDLSPGAQVAKMRRGIAIIVHGPPECGRTTQSQKLSELYNVPSLRIDEVVCAHISECTSSAGKKARQLCIEAELVRQREAEEAATAVTTQSQDNVKKHSLKEKEKDKDADRSQELEEPQLPPAEPKPFTVNVMEGTDLEVSNGSLLPTSLPEDLVVEMLTERILQQDCFRGTVVDGLDSQFIQNPIVAGAVVLKSFGDRKHIYFLNLSFSYDDLMSRREKREQEEESKRKEIEDAQQLQVDLERVKEEALLALSEDEFEALDFETKERIERKRYELKKERLRRKQQEKEDRERMQREQEALEEARRLEEEREKKSKKRGGTRAGGPSKPGAHKGTGVPPDLEGHPPGSRPPSTIPQHVLEGVTSGVLHSPMHSGSQISMGGDTVSDMDNHRKKSRRKDDIQKAEHEPEIPITKKWYLFLEASSQNLSTMLEDWDRSIGAVRPLKLPSELELSDHQTRSSVTPKQKGGKGKKEKFEQDKDRIGNVSSKSSLLAVPSFSNEDREENREGLGVPVVAANANQDDTDLSRELLNKLPPPSELLDEMGMGPNGPPIQEPICFSLVHCPVKRQPLEPEKELQFVFIAATPDDPNLISDGPPPVKVPVEPELDAGMKGPSEQAKMTKRSLPTKPVDGEPKKAGTPKSRRDRRASKTASPIMSTPPPDPEPVQSEPTILEDEEMPKLVRFRWVIPPNSEKTLKLRFTSDRVGTVDQTLNFEILGTKRNYQLFCRGHCTIPSISKEPRIMFPTRMKEVSDDDIVHKSFIISSENYMFGPLHCGKPREKHREGLHSENLELLNILNNSLLPVEISFFFESDHNATTFLLHPPTMSLKPGDKEVLHMWAYPKAARHYEDCLVGCIKDNPEPVVFPISCDGVQPDIEVDKKLIEFGKVLLRRRESRQLHLRNNTLLPVAWKLSGLDSIGDEFTFSADSGIVAPKSEFTVNIHFRALKANTYKRAIKLEASDVEQFMGLMHTEAIQIHAEAYDVALDISFPRGTDGGLDFQCIKVYEEAKLVCHLKNKGKYDIAYHFMLETYDGVNMSKFFTVSPTHSTLYPGDKAQAVAIAFKANREIVIKEQPVLKCQVMDMHLNKEGEVIASIPIKLSAKAIFAKYTITPKEDINFGAVVLNNKKTLTLGIENGGIFEFRYTMTKPSLGEQGPRGTSIFMSTAATKRARSRESVTSIGRTSQMIKSRKPDGSLLRSEGLPVSQRLTTGMFTVQPAYGTVQPRQIQNVTVDFSAESIGKFEEVISIDIADRPKNEDRIMYKICGEVVVPCIDLTGVPSIFEEHRICKQLSVLGSQQAADDSGVGVYGEENKKFVFHSVIVGHNAKARFKLSNPHKIPCDVNVAVKSVAGGTKLSKSIIEGFDVTPNKVTIQSHSHCFVTVTFKPTAMQTYTAVFEAVVESPIPIRQRTLSFELQGEGNLPQVSILKPTLRDGYGNLMLVFKRLLVGFSQSMPIVLKNESMIPARVTTEMMHGGSSFSVIPTGSHSVEAFDDTDRPASAQPPVSTELGVGETGEFVVLFSPKDVQRHTGELRIKIRDNQFENTVIKMVGEGYVDNIDVENIRPLGFNPPVSVEDSEDTALLHNHLTFGDLPVGTSRQISFTLVNHSPSLVYRFETPALEGLSFLPSVGHLHPRASKEITVTLNSERKLVLKRSKIEMTLTTIAFTQPLSQVVDWDDRMRSVKWVTASETPVEPDVNGVTNVSSRPPSVLTGRPVTAPAKRKVVETEPEPPHSVVEDSQRTLGLVVSGVVDYCKYECSVGSIKFKDTLMYQTRYYSFSLKNSGDVALTFQWASLDDPLSSVSHTSLHLNDAGSIISEGCDVCPFTIEPVRGKVLPGEECKMVLKFSPLDVRQSEARFQCNIPYLDASLSPLLVTVSGMSLMPYCHFELEESDYLTSGRYAACVRSTQQHGPTAPVPRDISTKVIEFHSCGVGVKQVRHFNIINPTNTPYTFMWVCEEKVAATDTPPFKCLTPSGQVAAGKKYQMAFEFVPTSVDVVEASWRFSISSHSITTSFLLVGHTSEPAVTMDRAYLNFKALLKGTRAKETVYIINNESSPYSFNFVESSLSSDSNAKELKVEPLSGSVPPNSRVPVTVFFTAQNEREYNFNVQCNVKRKLTPITLNVKAEVYAINVSMECEAVDGSIVKLDQGKSTFRRVDMGTVQVNEKSVRVLSIVNGGKYGFEYSWDMNERCCTLGGLDGNLITVTPKEGTVDAHQRAPCVIDFNPTSTVSLKGCQLELKIKNGPILPIVLSGKAVEPVVALSFTEYNFGPCFVSKQRSDLPPRTVKLTISNKDKKDVSITCFPPQKPYLDVFFKPGVVAAGDSTHVDIAFHPREPIKCHDTLWFEINGVSRIPVVIKGQGAEMKVEVANPSQKTVNLGALRAGDKVTKPVKLINRSPVEVNFSVNILPSLSDLVFQENVLRVSPSTVITLPPNGGTCTVQVTFAPTARVQQFSEEVILEASGIAQPLFMVTGSCQGMELSLDSSHVPFGAVVLQSRSRRRILMYNKGDIGAKFQWKLEEFGPDFSITPTEGYISSGMEVPFEITFHPTKVSQDIRYDGLECMIDGKPMLQLTLTGMCIEQTPLKEVLHFTSNVRGKEKRQLTLHNKTNSTWLLHPVISGEHWTGPDTLTVPPGKAGHYELTYTPMTMTSETQKHQGSIFFPLPDGSGILYNLLGSSDPPKAAGSITQEIPCKTAHTEILHVNNWLHRPQRFHAVIDSIRPEKLDRSVKLHGLEYIDVPAMGRKDYRLNFYAHKEGSFTAKVTFKNDQTGEYLFYNVSFKAIPPGVISTIDLTTPVRKSVPHRVSVVNPLPTQVTFHTSVNVLDISLPSTFDVGAESEGSCTFEFLPLKVGETVGKLTLNAAELGVYQYELRLKATAPPPEKAVHFMTTLGSNISHSCKFISFAKGRTEYSCKVDNSDFHVERSVQASSAGAGGGVEVSVDVQFEPGQLGDTKSILSISSPIGGEYLVPLFGHCLPPKPQGPFSIRAGSSINIPFKNVLSRSAQFVFHVDNPAFIVKANDILKAKKTYHILVTYDAKQADSLVAKMGKMVVSSPKSAGSGSSVSWTYYLRGEPHDKQRGSMSS